MVVGIFVGRFLGVGDYIIEVGGSGLKVAQRVDFGGVGCGRAWVISLPIFFLGKYFHFWKPPPLFCINSRDNVYYPIFLACYIVRKTNIKYTVICISGIGRSVKMLSQNQRFSLGKARESVLSLPHLSIHPQPKQPNTKLSTTPQQPYNNTTLTPHLTTLLLSPHTPHHTHQRP